ncbi:MAG: hypothetical protein M1840_003700 [Geoglossum simile]|nr:MAG: hypothetical protein M1840_003700 [Geoglossum simile]
MSNNTRLAVVKFTAKNQSTRFIRVYYQKESAIRELCWDPSNGWHLKRNHIVTSAAKRDSPIAAVIHNSGNEITRYQTHVYFLNNESETCECIRLSSSLDDTGEWNQNTEFPKQVASPSSQLAAAYSGKNKENIHVFYQESGNTIRELKYEEDQGWGSGDELGEAHEGSGLAVTSMSTLDLRLFYQAVDCTIKQWVTSEVTDWESCPIESFQMSPKAPISAVVWDKPSFQIRLYSVRSHELLEMVYRKKWVKGITSKGKVTGKLLTSPPIAVAAVRMPYDKTIRVFYPYEANSIGESIVSEDKEIHFSMISKAPANNLQAEVTPLNVYTIFDSQLKSCQDLQVQESGVWPEKFGLASESAKRVDELRDKIKSLEERCAQLQKEQFVDGINAQQWKDKYDQMHKTKSELDSSQYVGGYNAQQWKKQYDYISNEKSQSDSRLSQFYDLIKNMRTTAHSAALAVDTIWTLRDGASGHLSLSDRRWTVQAILNSAFTDASFDANDTWTSSYRSLP